MRSPTTPQAAATLTTPAMSQTTAQAPSEASTRSASPFTADLEMAPRGSPQTGRGNTFWAEPMYMEYSPSVTPGSSPPYTRQTSVVDLEALVKEPYINANLKPVHGSKEPYHVFSHGKKWSIVILIGVAGLFSGLSSNIYFPALDAIAEVGIPQLTSSISELISFC